MDSRLTFLEVMARGSSSESSAAGRLAGADSFLTAFLAGAVLVMGSSSESSAVGCVGGWAGGWVDLRVCVSVSVSVCVCVWVRAYE